jgi:hypothetical protein
VQHRVWLPSTKAGEVMVIVDLIIAGALVGIAFMIYTKWFANKKD